MTAEEAIKLLGTAKQSLKEQVPVLTKINPQISKSLGENALMIIEAYSMAIEALEEVEQYRALGTVEELKEAKEKQIPKKPVKKNPICYSKTIQGEEHYAYDFHCVQCGAKINGEGHHCPCGQAVDWSEE